MKIVRIDATQVVVPMKPGTTNSPEFGERPFQWEPIFILQIHSDDGFIGLGETPRNVPRSAVEAGIEALIGKNPLRMNLQELSSLERDESLRSRASRADLRMNLTELSQLGSNPAYNGFETALCDLVGKALGIPVYQLLGGAHRDRVWVSYWTGTRTPEDLVRVAYHAWEEGFRALKCKCRWGEPYIEQMTAVAEALPEMQIVCDFNTDLRRPVEAAKLALKVRHLDNILVWEDPVPHWDYGWYVGLRQQVHIPIAAHLGHPTDLVMAIRQDAIDYVNLGGGLFRFTKMAGIAEAAGIPCWHGAGIELGIGTMSYVHACAAAKGCILPSDILGSTLREDDLIQESVKIEDGYAIVPDRPGLGVELDEEALAKYRVS